MAAEMTQRSQPEGAFYRDNENTETLKIGGGKNGIGRNTGGDHIPAVENLPPLFSCFLSGVGIGQAGSMRGMARILSRVMRFVDTRTGLPHAESNRALSQYFGFSSRRYWCFSSLAIARLRTLFTFLWS